MKSTNVSSGRRVSSVLLDFDQIVFAGTTEGCQLTASNKRNSHIDLKRIDETIFNINKERGDLTVNERNLDRQTYFHHSF